VKKTVIVYRPIHDSSGFQGLEEQTVPEMTYAYIEAVSEFYIKLYEHITGEYLLKNDISNIQHRIEMNILEYLGKQVS
jgi:phosphoribosylaminoimidazole-succinocarboxamide synthase